MQVTSHPHIHAEECQAGQAWDLGSHTITEQEIIDFATQWDPQYFHINPERAAAESPFQGLIASGLHTVGIYQRLSVNSWAGSWRVIAGSGFDEVRFHRPVRPGDTLSGSTRVDSVEMEPDRGRGLVTCTGHLTNQHGKRVLSIRLAAYVVARHS